MDTALLNKNMADLNLEIAKASQLVREALSEIEGIKDVLLGQRLNTAEACKKLKVSRATLQKLRESGQLGFYQKGRNFEYSNKHIMDYLNSVSS